MNLAQQQSYIRFLDITISIIAICFFIPIFLIITMVLFFDTGRPFFVQKRLGRYEKPFSLLKFRTMKIGTADLASHLVDASSITPMGKVLRRFKFDELPQILNVLIGDMSFVGPRPNLPSQIALIRHRREKKVYEHLPGITGAAQLRKVDMSSPELLSDIDSEMMETMSIKLYFKILLKTMLGAGKGDAALD